MYDKPTSGNTKTQPIANARPSHPFQLNNVITRRMWCYLRSPQHLAHDSTRKTEDVYK